MDNLQSALEKCLTKVKEERRDTKNGGKIQW